jgi:hypothetical protein
MVYAIFIKSHRSFHKDQEKRLQAKNSNKNKKKLRRQLDTTPHIN